MSTTTPVFTGPSTDKKPSGLVSRTYSFLNWIPTGLLWILVVIWSVPTVGLLLNSFRHKDAQRNTGWWKIRSDELTLGNYDQIFAARAGLGRSLLNSGAIAIPLQVALIPLLQLFVNGASLTLPFLDKTVVLIPDSDLAGTTTAAWLTHTGFAMPFAIFLLHNYISALPRDLFEAARIDGANHFTIFWRLVLPLSVPVLAAFAIFQFLWTWNDYLVANTMNGANASQQPTTILIADLAGDFGKNENILPASAFVQAYIPLIVFFSLQRYFVRGILAGSVKG